MGIEYQEFEERLARLHSVADDDRKAFKGRLRVLRNWGVPDKPALGSGKRLTFDKVDLLETHIALRLSAFGLSPLRTALAIKHLRQSLANSRTTLQGIVDGYGETTWLMLDVRSNVGKAQDIGEDVEAVVWFVTLEIIKQYFTIMSTPPTHSNWQAIINASQLLRDIEG